MRIASFLGGAVGLMLAAGSASAGALPGMKGMDHVGVTVPDMDQAVTFFVDVLGCQKAMSFGPFSDDKGTFMQDLVNVHPRSVIENITLIRCGNGSNIELFKYTAPDQKTEEPKNSDIGGHHIAFYTTDIAAASAYLKDSGIRQMMGPVPIQEGPAAGQSIQYFLSPWGMQFEIITYPDGMAYEKDGGPVLWSPKNATN